MRFDSLSLRHRLLVTLLTAAVLAAGVYVLLTKPFAARGIALTARVGAAGQGLSTSSPVKQRGMAIGRVEKIELAAEGGAVITLRMDPGVRVPDTSTAAVEPESVFGPKFVNLIPGEHEEAGPYLADGAAIVRTAETGDLNDLLVQTEAALAAVDPEDVAVILDALGQGLGGQGARLRDLLGSTDVLVKVADDHSGDARTFAADLARLARIRGIGEDLGTVLESSTTLLETLTAGRDRGLKIAEGTAEVSATMAHGFEAYGDDLGAGVRSAENAVQVIGAQLGIAGDGLRTMNDLLPIYRAVGWAPGPGGKHMLSVKIILPSDPCQMILGVCGSDGKDREPPQLPGKPKKPKKKGGG